MRIIQKILFYNNALCYDKGKATTDDILDINMDYNIEIIARNKRVLELSTLSVNVIVYEIIIHVVEIIFNFAWFYRILAF